MQVTGIKYVRNMFEGPAASDLSTGIIYIDLDWDAVLTPDQRRMVRLHEEGHIVLQTTNEEEADKFAFDIYVKEGRSLKESVRSLSDVLGNAGPEESGRVAARINDALYYDWKVNKNYEALALLQNNNSTPSQIMCSSKISDLQYFLGLPKFGDIVNNLVDNRNKKVDAKLERKQTKAEADATAKLLLAQQGINKQTFGNTFGIGLGSLTAGTVKALINPASIPGSASDLLNHAFNADGTPNTAYQAPLSDAAQKEADEKKQTTYIVIGVVVVIVIAAVVFFTSKKN